MIFVFLSNKLIALDTILPLLRELKLRSPQLRFEFFCFEPKTDSMIRENIVLYDVLVSLGQLRMLGRAGDGWLSFLWHRVWVSGVLLRIAVWLLHSKTRLLHFKALNTWPLKLFACLAPTRTVLVQGTALGYAPLEKRASDLMQNRIYRRVRPAGRHLLAFSEHWPLLENLDISNYSYRLTDPPYRLNSWLSHLRASEAQYVERELRAAGHETTSDIVTIILTWMGPSGLLRKPNDFPKLLDETLEALSEACPDLPVFIRPHPATRPEERAILEKLYRKWSRVRPVITVLHPMILAMRSRFAIGNAYSTTFASFRCFDVPTIEYTDYAPAILAETNGGSIRPDFVTNFVNRDAQLLRELLRQFSAAPRRAEPVSSVRIPNDVFTTLTGVVPTSTCTL